MGYRVFAVLSVVLLVAGCGGNEVPYAPHRPPSGEGDGGPGGGAKLEPGQCWNEQDCETGKACKPSELIESANKFIEIIETGTPGECATPPLGETLMLRGLSAIRFTQSGGSVDPARDDFVEEQGAFDVDFSVEVQGVTQAIEIGGFELPRGHRDLPGFGFYWMIDMHLRVVDPNDPSFDVECDLRFFPSGEMQGGVAREPGQLVCSKDNWQTPQDGGDPGLLITYELLPVEPDPGPIEPSGEVCSRSALPANAPSAVGTMACHGLAGDDTVFEVHVSAEPLGPIGDATEFEVQAQLINPEAIVDLFGDVLQSAVLYEGSLEVSAASGGEPVALAVETPCDVRYTDDPDGNGTLGPTVMTTEATTAVWSAVDGSITVEATELDFRLVSGVNITLSTRGNYPTCAWTEVPRLTFGSGM